tara:strand:- start:489 stop:1496 length:1008 start_codon:yes stop_codon:yes gene_type:complete
MDDEKFMRRCIALAKKGLGFTYPNPLVGCVIVHQGKIISEGWHKKAGESHAEKEAIEKIKDKSILNKVTLYVNLEPCNHFGETPPCSDLIVKMNIPRVVIGTLDFNQKVYLKGIKKLKENGCEVITGILEKECRKLNCRFFTFHQKKRPYITLKWAESKDGFIAPKDQNEKYWLSHPLSKQLVHQWRGQEQSIMIGINTALIDNPKLSLRHWYGKNPIAIVIDPKNKLPNESFLFKNKKTNNLLSITSKEINIKNEGFKKEDFISILYENKIQSVIIEGGLKTLVFFIKNNLWDEAKVFKTKVKLNNGLISPKLEQKEKSIISVGSDKLYTYINF